MSWIKYIGDAAHYNEVLSRVVSIKSSLWIGTADIKDLYVKLGADQILFLGVVSRLIEGGVEVRLIHAKEPGPIFREEFDCKVAYMGSANLTGAVSCRLCHGPFRWRVVRDALQRLRPPEILR